jgi:hypothetical protein
MAKTFPKFPSHDDASCFNCGGDFGPGYWFESGQPAGHGAFEQHCEKCRLRTWYDIEPQKFVLESTGPNRFKLHLTN